MISDTRSKKVNENVIRHFPVWKMKPFLSFVSSIEKEEHGNSVKIEVKSITSVLQAYLDFYR